MIGCQDKFHHFVKKKTSLALRALGAYVLLYVLNCTIFWVEGKRQNLNE